MKNTIAKALIFLGLIFSISSIFAAENNSSYKLATCTSAITQEDVVAVDHDKDGTPIEFKRNPDDIAKLLAQLKAKIKDDPSITKSKYWRKEMLTLDYWLLTACGGTTNCSSKQCSSGRSCFYGNIGMAGCRCG